jgi:hypothetical protein
MRSLQRFLAAALAFVVAALWMGLPLKSGLECLLVFAVVHTIVGVLQRVRARAQHNRRDVRRSRLEQMRPVDVARRRPAAALGRARAVYDLDRHAVDEDWAIAADSTW